MTPLKTLALLHGGLRDTSAVWSKGGNRLGKLFQKLETMRHTGWLTKDGEEDPESSSMSDISIQFKAKSSQEP